MGKIEKSPNTGANVEQEEFDVSLLPDQIVQSSALVAAKTVAGNALDADQLSLSAAFAVLRRNAGRSGAVTKQLQIRAERGLVRDRQFLHAVLAEGRLAALTAVFTEAESQREKWSAKMLLNALNRGAARKVEGDTPDA